MARQAVLLLVTLAACLVSQGFAFRIGFGGCPNKKGVSNFNLGDRFGTWYEYSRLAPEDQELNPGKCDRITYTAKTNLSSTVKLTEVKLRTGQEQTVEGTAVQPVAYEGKFVLTLSTSWFGFASEHVTVLATGNHFAVEHSCVQSWWGLSKYESVRVLTVESNPAGVTKVEIEKAIYESGLSEVNFRKTPQNCHRSS